MLTCFLDRREYLLQSIFIGVGEWLRRFSFVNIEQRLDQSDLVDQPKRIFFSRDEAPKLGHRSLDSSVIAFTLWLVVKDVLQAPSVQPSDPLTGFQYQF